tara:strand:- start:498 stop:908 length:411 start_codon:yes stop_codon:yes gene_type:complete
LNNKISDKDKKDWKDFIYNKEKLPNKDLQFENNKKGTRTMDLHGFSLEDANKIIEKLIIECFEKNIIKIVVITGKGLRSKNKENPYASKDLSILKYSVPEFIKSQEDLMKKIKKISEADVEDGGEGAFYIFLKKKE